MGGKAPTNVWVQSIIQCIGIGLVLNGGTRIKMGHCIAASWVRFQTSNELIADTRIGSRQSTINDGINQQVDPFRSVGQQRYW